MNSLIAGNFHLILVKIFLYLDGRTLTSASKVGSCEARELVNAVEQGVLSNGADLAVAAKRIETDFNGSRFDQTFQTGPKSVQPY